MGTFTSKIAELKEQINSTYSSYVSTLTDTYNGNYANSIIWALRTMGKQARINIKTVWIPIQAGQRQYSMLPTLYTKDKIEMTKASDLALVAIGSDHLPTISKGDSTTIESIERNEFIDWVKFAQKMGQSVSNLKMSTTPLNQPWCRLSPIIAVTDDDTFTTAILPIAGDTVVNLDKIDNTIYTADTVLSASGSSSPYTVNLTNKRLLAGSFYAWEVGDILCYSTTYPSFISLTFESIPKFGYLTASGDLSNEIPVMPQFYDDIDDLAIKYLFKILGQRDPEKINLYVGMVKSGLIRSEPEIIRDIKIRSNTIDTIQIENYQPYTQRYGR